MRPIADLTPAEAAKLRALLFDLDDTFLDGTRLNEAAFHALTLLRDAGLALLAVTGRPSGWGEVIARQWPVTAAVTENGAIACGRGTARFEVYDFAASERLARREALGRLVSRLRSEFPDLTPTDDVNLRVSDFTFDVGEHECVPRERVAEVRRRAHALGARTVVSSVHLHVTLDGLDKASGTALLLRRKLGMDPTESRFRAAFIGDSENDAACFAAFHTTIGVSNVSGRPTVRPRFVTASPRGAGFAEAAAVLLQRRREGLAAGVRNAAPRVVMDGAMEPSEAELVKSASAHLYPNYRQPPFALARGRGSEVWDQSGKRYLDLAAGIAVCSLGHAHPAWATAVATQAARLAHVSNYFYNVENVKLAERLTRLAGMDRVFFCNSGTEAIEASLKLARRHFFAKGQPERVRVIAFDNSFHGRTLGALAATGQKGYREGFGPLSPVTHVPYGDLAAVKAQLGADVACILVEPVQGEGGVLPAPRGFLEGLRTIADEHGVLLLADEVQTGIGRTGRFLAFEHAGVQADVVALAKGLGGGFPVGAMLCKEKLSEALPPGSHGSTFGGNALASAAALAVLDTVERERLIDGARDKGEHLGRLLASLATVHERFVEGARGLGLLQALVLKDGVDARSVVGNLRDEGLLVTIAGSRALRFSPSLTVSIPELDEGAAIVDRVLKAL